MLERAWQAARQRAPSRLPPVPGRQPNSFVLVSNRGHNSIAVFAIKKTTRCGEAGYLSVVNYCHTKGKTPRHFQFDPSGAFLLSANQDTDSVTIFRQGERCRNRRGVRTPRGPTLPTKFV